MTKKRLIQIVASVVLIALLYQWIDVDQLVEVLRDANLALLGLALLLVTANRVLMAVKWNVLLAARGVVISGWQATKIYYTSTFLGLFLPPTVGADIVRSWLVTRGEARMPDVVSSILVERVLGLVALGVFGVVAAALFPLMMQSQQIDPTQLLAIAGLAMLVALSAFAFSLTAACERLVLAVTDRLATVRFVGKLSGTLAKIYQSYREYRGNRAALAWFFVLTLVENALPILRAYLVALALHAPVELTWFFVIVPLELLLIRIPISFDGFGLREGLFVYFLSLVGISETMGFAIGLTNHMLFLVAVLPGGLFYAMDPTARPERIGS